MKKSLNFFAALLLGTTVLVSCGDDEDTKPVITPEKISAMELHFDSRYGTEDFILNKPYLTASNEEVKIASLAYFISNVELVNADGTTWKEPNSYHLVQNEDQEEKEEFLIKNIPAGTYTKLRYMVGVDSVRNQSLAQAVGDLKDNNHMTWMWNTGYIFMHIKGLYENPAATPTSQVFSYDVGKEGQQGMVELTLPAPTLINTEKNPKIHLHADVKAVFGGPNVIQIKNLNFIDGSPQGSVGAGPVADNFASMFKIDHIH